MILRQRMQLLGAQAPGRDAFAQRYSQGGASLQWRTANDGAWSQPAGGPLGRPRPRPRARRRDRVGPATMRRPVRTGRSTRSVRGRWACGAVSPPARAHRRSRPRPMARRHGAGDVGRGLQSPFQAIDFTYDPAVADLHNRRWFGNGPGIPHCGIGPVSL